MTFKIKSDDDNLYESADKAYREHLSKFSKKNHSDLWRYFYWDFFHDGWIEDITFQNGSDKLIFKITCPNIKKKTGEKDFEYINVSFRCIFSDVIYFKFTKGRDTEETAAPDTGQFTFLYSEINSLTEHIPKKTEEGFGEYQSLIIEVMSAHGPGNSSYIELVFGDLTVQAIECTAFQLMLTSPDFEIPIYTENE